MLRSFRARLVTGFVAVILLTLLLAASGFVLLLRQQQQEAAEQRIGTLVGPITQGARDMEALGWPTQVMRSQLSSVARYYEVRILLLDSSSRAIIDTHPDQPLLGELLELPAAEPVEGRPAQAFAAQRMHLNGADLYLFTSGAPAQSQMGSLVLPSGGRLVLAVPAGDVTAAWAQLLPRLAMAGTAAAVLAVIVASLMTSRIVNRVEEVTRASQAMARGDLNQRIEVDGDDEVGRLAEAFNHMSTQVSRSNAAMHDLLANVSHELRTPLTSIQGFSQALVDGLPGDSQEVGSVILDEADRMRLLVDDLLYLSEIESGALPLDIDRVDIDAVIEGSVRRFRFQAEEAQVALRTELAGESVRADGRRLEQVVANLLDNAIRFAPAQTEVLLSSRRVARGVLVEVHNFGEPIPGERPERVFDRFYQVDEARSDSRHHRGLGLSIVQELVQAHDGTIGIESTVERGTTVSVFFPTRGPSSAAPHHQVVRPAPSVTPAEATPDRASTPREASA